MTVKFLFNLQNPPTFNSEERLVNLVRGRECFVVLSTLVYVVQDVSEQADHGEGPGGVHAGPGEEPTHQVPDGKCCYTIPHFFTFLVIPCEYFVRRISFRWLKGEGVHY